MEPLAVDHGAVPDGGEALGGAEHQGVLHPHTGKHLGIMSKVANCLKIQDIIQVMLFINLGIRSPTFNM